MRLPTLIALGLCSIAALAQDPLPMPGVLADVRVKGDVKSAETANGGIRELAEFVVRFTVPDGVEPPSESLIIDFNGIPPSPCGIVAIPAGAFIPTNDGKGYRLISDDPKISGVQILQADDFGNLVGDLTGQVSRLQARLHQVEGAEGTWRLVIEARADTATDNPVWLPAAQSIGTNLIVGPAKGTGVARRASFVQIDDPPTGIPQEPIDGPDLSAALADLRITGEVRLREPDDDTLREVVEINARFALGLSDGIQPPSESLIIDFNGVPPSPCNIVAIPAGAFIPTNDGKGYRLISDDPKISGVRHLLTDGQGQFLADLTPNMRRFDAVLRPDDDGGWRLKIEAVSRTPGEVNWLPILSPGANLSFGNDYGSTLTRRVEFVHGQPPPDDT